MDSDEQAIRELLDTLLRATREGDVDTVVATLAEDIVFLTPGNEPFGREAFEKSSRERDAEVDATVEVEELHVLGDWAWMRNHLTVTMTPPDGEPVRRSGHTLTILRKEPDGRWVMARDANLLPPPG
jgi:uncharacterized protein (TIGR02246 family)